MSIVSATVTSIALGLCLVVGVRVAPVAWRVIRFDQNRERDLLMVSWGLMWAAVVPPLSLRAVCMPLPPKMRSAPSGRSSGVTRLK